MSIGVLAGMFFFTYLPQVAVLAVVTGPLGESVLLVCEFESAVGERMGKRVLMNVFLHAQPLLVPFHWCWEKVGSF